MNLICFSHLRWNFVFQRPQHLLSRMAKQFIVFYVEEPFYGSPVDRTSVTLSEEKVWVVVPYLKGDPGAPDTAARQAALLDIFFAQFGIRNYIFWYYTPMALPYTRHFQPKLVVYDSMDELSAFKFAPAELVSLEDELFSKADIVFTGGHSLYEAKKHRHQNIHPFPSSIDKAHFSMARHKQVQPADQEKIPYPRLGFFGVLDERFDIELVEQVALAKPDWQIVLLGPVVKIDPDTLPKHKNIHYLGSKTYQELPQYLAGWQVALIPFAINESTRFISPTKTPEYLAAGKPVISTPIRDVVHPYGTRKLVHIVENAEDFISYAQEELGKSDRKEWLQEVDNFLSGNSWDITCSKMQAFINSLLNNTSKNNSGEKTAPVVPLFQQPINQQEVQHV
jgi:glycosyltransferase involved in cell wall biosynthesis